MEGSGSDHEVFVEGSELDENWQQWLSDNVRRGCDNLELFYTLVKQGFAIRSIKQHMGADYPYLAPAEARPGDDFLSSRCDYDNLANVALTRSSGDSRIKYLDDHRVQLYVIDGFMNEQECARMVEKIESRLHPSVVTFHNGDDSFRTSRTCELHSIRDAFIENIDDRICKCLGIRGAYSEGIQGQQYQKGQEFKAHNDYFEPGTQEYEQFAGNRGQRTWTFMVYLDASEEGGATHFVNLGVGFVPVIGRAVVWNNLLADGTPNPCTKHHGQPVKCGKKTIITKWFRDKGLGPVFC